jgi:hypothetical protein
MVTYPSKLRCVGAKGGVEEAKESDSLLIPLIGLLYLLSFGALSYMRRQGLSLPMPRRRP